MSSSLSKSSVTPRRVHWIPILGALAVIIALAGCGGDSTQESTSTAASSTTTTPSTTATTPTTTTSGSTTTAPSSTTTVPPDTTGATSDFDLRVDTRTEWGDVFDALTRAEQECVRDTFDGDTLESVLALPVMSEAETPEAWVILIFSCLAPETAQAVFLSTMVAGLGEDEAFELDADTEACLAEWVAGLDVVATMLALSIDDTEVTRDVTTAFLTCNRDLIVSLMLEETGLTLEDLSEEEASCLREWVTDTDWTNLLTGSADDPSGLMGFAADLIECAPDMFISSMLEETGMTLEDLSEEEASCLREWVTDTDWTSLLTGSADDPGLFEFLPGLFDCVPDLAWSAAGALPSDELLGEATPVEIGVSVPGELEYADDRDYFAFEATEGEFYDLDLTLGTLEDSVLDLYDADGNWLDGNDDYGDSTASRLIWLAPSTGTYYVEVTSFGTGTGTYTLTVSDITDDHPNSTANATPVEVGTAVEGELEYAGDRDFFTFEATEGEYYELDVTPGTLQDPLVEIFDADGNWLTRQAGYDNTIWYAPSTGSHYVQVTGFDTGTYTFTITVSDITDDHPNSTANATAVEIGTATQGELEYGGDADLFAFQATEGKIYDMEVTLGTLQDSVLELQDAGGDWLAGNDDYGDLTASRLIWNAPSSGTYYVQVTGFDISTGTYTLTITVSDITDDHANSAANATAAEIGTAVEGEMEYEGDGDYFTFEATAGEFYELAVTLGTLQDSVLDLYDTDSTWLAGNDDYGDLTASRLIWNAPSSGTYYVQVTGFDTGTGTYTLTVTVSDIVDDHPNSVDNATTVELGVGAEGELEYESDSDFFAFEATAGEFYDLDVTLGTLEDSVLDLFDGDGNWLDGNDDYGDSTASRLIWLAPTTATYYVQVTSFGTGTGTYTLTVATAL